MPVRFSGMVGEGGCSFSRLCAALTGGHASFSHTHFASPTQNLQSVNTSFILAVGGERSVMMARTQKETTKLFPIKNDLACSVR